MRVADLAYALGGEEIGRVRCDGLVVATPQGSTGYNLANGGPVLAWGVEGFVVSFIAPHSLTARALVVAPDDLLTVHNALARGAGRACTSTGARRASWRPAARRSHVRVRAQPPGALAQLAGRDFYHRLREQFGRLARSRAPPLVPLRPRIASRGARPVRRGRLVDPRACCTSCASRTSC